MDAICHDVENDDFIVHDSGFNVGAFSWEVQRCAECQSGYGLSSRARLVLG
jgi:hypothetical protein